jgi:putative ABC transport system permease protein
MIVIKLLGLLLGLAIVVGLVRMAILVVVQWRDLISFDRWTEVFITIGRNKLRTTLTMISVAWGILVLVSLLGLGNGLDKGARKKFARNATNGVWINANKTSVAHAGYDVGRRLMFENADYERAKRVEGIEHLSAEHWLYGQRWRGGLMTTRGAKANSFEVDAVHAQSWYLKSHQMVNGRFLTEADIAGTRKSAVIGKMAADFLFGADQPIGEWIVVGGVPFQVVGVFIDPEGNEEERRIYLPISTAQLSFNGGERVGQLQLTVGNRGPEETQEIIDKVVAQLAERHKFSADDPHAVRVHNNIEQFDRFRKMFWLISTFVLVIGLGTLAAGVVGVSNIMMIAVKERTKEIGVRKALGATPSSIVFMILQEAVFLTAIAGLLGLAGGLVTLEVIEAQGFSAIHDPRIELSTGIAATVFLVIAGAFAGYFPARAAAKVNPIHALRDQ